MNLSSELNQSCEELRLFGNQELSDNADLGLRYFAFGYNIVVFPISLSLTAFIIFLIIKFKHLQQTTFFLALQVIISGFLFALFRPAAVISTIDGQWSTGIQTCNISGGVFAFLFQLCQWIMFVFVCDCFFTMPFRYNRHRRKVILFYSASNSYNWCSTCYTRRLIALVSVELFGYVSVPLTRHVQILSFVSCSQ